MSTAKSTDLALSLLRRLPRVGLTNLKPLKSRAKYTPRGQDKGGDRGYKGQAKRQTLPKLGFEGGSNPYYTKHPVQWYYKGHELKRQYPPLSMLQIQRMVDTGLLNTDEPIDLVQICNTFKYRIDPLKREFGINLIEDGIELFVAKINLEVQWTTEAVIAAVEKNGGTITLAYYDPWSLQAMCHTQQFFSKGIPIPRRALPPENCLDFYSNAKVRGYLADPVAVSQARVELAQKYGYTLPDISTDPKHDMLMKRKDPRQPFYDLEPGWVVNLKDKVVLKPTDEKILAYYRS